MVVGKLLDDGRVVSEGKKYQKAVELGTKVMTEKEFEMLCRQKFDNPDFILGRKRVKDKTEGAFDYYAGDTSNPEQDALNKIEDISDLLTESDSILPKKRQFHQTSAQPPD